MELSKNKNKYWISIKLTLTFFMSKSLLLLLFFFFWIPVQICCYLIVCMLKDLDSHISHPATRPSCTLSMLLQRLMGWVVINDFSSFDFSDASRWPCSSPAGSGRAYRLLIIYVCINLTMSRPDGECARAPSHVRSQHLFVCGRVLLRV